jgi:uncharacterized protein
VKVFLDTNVLASAFSARGLCADVVGLILEEHELLVGEVVLEELKTVLRRKFNVPPATVSQLESFLREYAVEPLPHEIPNFLLKDHNDLLVIASAVNAGAEIVVTGDSEILHLKRKPLRIVSPREFWILASPGKNRR